ncbi:MAG: hypothetical protein A2075_06750 [Geobacteraceae bacterium GWC2_58_44]|nr:MAG: hypothetical protein A2075_06750 [Geobacteraceae bacterium GWC2_58_44]HBG08254.1 hypothetical protein [Geobacter sp.]
MNARLHTSPSASGGFTLIEVLMAMLIMTVGLLGLLQSVNIAYEHNIRGRLREEALVLAEEQMNNWRIRGYDNITGADNISTVARVIGGRPKRFTVARQCREMGSGSKRLRVAVRWDYKGMNTEHEIFTIKNK